MRSDPRKVPSAIVVDLDGPILDTSRRHHACYSRILLAAGCRPLDLRTYWRLKRQRASLGEVLAMSGGAAVRAADFDREWLRLIEQPSLLALDTLQEGALQTLRAWRRQKFRVVLASMRRNRPNARQQLGRLGIWHLFDAVAFSRPDRGPEGKAAVVASVLAGKSSPGTWIGDTEADVTAARIGGFRSIAVTCGIRTRHCLSELGPDLIVPRLAAIRRDQIFPAASDTSAPTR